MFSSRVNFSDFDAALRRAYGVRSGWPFGQNYKAYIAAKHYLEHPDEYNQYSEHDVYYHVSPTYVRKGYINIKKFLYNLYDYNDSKEREIPLSIKYQLKNLLGVFAEFFPVNVIAALQHKDVWPKQGKLVAYISPLLEGNIPKKADQEIAKVLKLTMIRRYLTPDDFEILCKLYRNKAKIAAEQLYRGFVMVNNELVSHSRKMGLPPAAVLEIILENPELLLNRNLNMLTTDYYRASWNKKFDPPGAYETYPGYIKPMHEYKGELLPSDNLEVDDRATSSEDGIQLEFLTGKKQPFTLFQSPFPANEKSSDKDVGAIASSRDRRSLIELSRRRSDD